MPNELELVDTSPEWEGQIKGIIADNNFVYVFTYVNVDVQKVQKVRANDLSVIELENDTIPFDLSSIVTIRQDDDFVYIAGRKELKKIRKSDLELVKTLTLLVDFRDFQIKEDKIFYSAENVFKEISKVDFSELQDRTSQMAGDIPTTFEIDNEKLFGMNVNRVFIYLLSDFTNIYSEWGSGSGAFLRSDFEDDDGFYFFSVSGQVVGKFDKTSFALDLAQKIFSTTLANGALEKDFLFVAVDDNKIYKCNRSDLEIIVTSAVIPQDFVVGFSNVSHSVFIAKSGGGSDDRLYRLYKTDIEPPTIDPPTITPESGTYTEPQVIEMEGADPAHIVFYTLDGSDPDETSEIYTEPFIISENTIVKAKSYNIALTSSSEVVTKIYYFLGGKTMINESQTAGLAALIWRETGSAVDKILGEVPLDGDTMLSIEEVVNYYNTKYAGANPTEAIASTGPATFTVDLIESVELREILSNTFKTKGTKVIGGLNTGKRAKTGKLTIHPLYAGNDTSEDVVLLKVSPQLTEERVYASENGRKTIKVVFTVMGVKTMLETPLAAEVVAAGGSGSTVFYRGVNANALGVSAASASVEGKIDNTSITIDPSVGATRFTVWRATATDFSAGVFSYELSNSEFEAGLFNPAGVTWVAQTTATPPTVATGYYYKGIEIG